jgi:hypothetical protein
MELFKNAILLTKIRENVIHLQYQKWGALKLRAEIKPLYLIRVMPAEGKKSSIFVSLINHPHFSDYKRSSGCWVLVVCCWVFKNQLLKK